MHLDDQVGHLVNKWPSGLQVQIRSQLFDHMDPMLIIRFLHAFKTAWDNNQVHEGAALGLVPSL